MTFGVHLGIDFHEILDFVIICENHPNAYIQSIWVGSAHSKPHIFRPKFNQKSKYAYAHAADPVSSLRWNPLRHLTFETPFSRFYKVPIPWTQRHPRDPTPTPTPQGTQGDPRARGGGGARGTQGRLRRPWGGWAHGTLWGYSEAIPNGMPFRVESYYERKPTPK